MEEAQHGLVVAVKFSSSSVAAISSEWWGEPGGGAPSGIQGQSPWSGGQRGIARLKLKIH